MKAAIIYQKDQLPEYTDVPEPIIESPDELLVTVRAVAIKHFDKGRATGRHYSSEATANGGRASGGDAGRVIGGDGIFVLPDGKRVFGIGASGTLAERATIYKDRIVPVPDGLDDATAAALPNAVIGAAMGLKFKAGVQSGDVVLINGATGFTGRIAVQLAKYYGAKKVIATGRNLRSLEQLLSLGADEIIPTESGNFATRLEALHATSPIDVIIDYLWGSTAETILSVIKGDGSFTNKIRYVSIGSVTGDRIQLSAAVLRSVDLQLTGSGLGAWSRQQVGQLFREILPEAFRLAAEGKLKTEVVRVKLRDIAELWELEVPGGQRLVVIV
ncbi:MAG: zinc-binding dehydrogenase [Bacteroidetes bacterium]|nr:zinc-binding dehydrogenase [Bacteroidota bacterium]